MNILLIKSLHIIFVITWFAGLFYLPRLFIYHTEALQMPIVERKALQDQFKIMSRRLLFGITWPSAIMVAIFGFGSASYFWPWTDHPWLIVKLVFVFFLYLYHFSLHWIYKELAKDRYPLTPLQLRMWNEVSTVFLFAIVFLVIFKSILHMGYGLMGLAGLIITLLMAIRVYKKIREDKNGSK
jgi:putative membrane protein